MLEAHISIYDFLKSLEFDLRADYLHFEFDTSLENYLNENSIEFEKIRTEEINIPYVNLGFHVYQNTIDFLTENNVRKEMNSLIIEYNSKPLSKIGDALFLNFQPKDLFFYSNARGYVEFIDFLKSQDQETEDAFHFIDYSNDVNRKIVLTSLTEKSRLILMYFKQIPIFSDEIDYTTGLNLFKKCFAPENHNFPKFLKSSVIKYASRYEQNDRVKQLFINLHSIVEDAKINFEIYINNLSIDKIRKDYDEYKSKYFDEVSGILKKITQQIIGFPIVIASTLFAIEKIKGNTSFLWILAVVILITTLYLILLLNMNYKDLGYVKQLSNRDYNAIKDNNFFVKFPEQFQTFQKIKSRISSRIENLLLICESYFWILCFSNTVMICLILHYLDVPIIGIIMIALVILFVMIIARNKIWKEKNDT